MKGVTQFGIIMKQIKFKCLKCRKQILRSGGYLLNGVNLCKVDYWLQFPKGRFILDKRI